MRSWARNGSRYATKTASGFGWLLADLHGNVAGASSSSLAAISDALRYDAYGQVTASVTSSLPTPWRYQGRLLVDPAGANDLYDAGARFYSPGLGVFTQLDSVQGSALDPLSLNRYLYAQADPETLVDPDGHASCKYGWEDCNAIAACSGHAIHHGTYRAPRPWLNRLPSWEIQMVGKGAKDRYSRSQNVIEAQFERAAADHRDTLVERHAQAYSRWLNQTTTSCLFFLCTRSPNYTKEPGYYAAGEFYVTGPLEAVPPAAEDPLMKPYGEGGGHHPLAKSAFRGDPLYNPG